MYLEREKKQKSQTGVAHLQQKVRKFKEGEWATEVPVLETTMFHKILGKSENLDGRKVENPSRRRGHLKAKMAHS